jgi:hypothetical protein
MRALARRLAPQSLSRFPAIKPTGRGVVLIRSHPAARSGRTIFPTTVNTVDDPRVKRLLKSGHNSRKIGRRVQKGRLRDFEVYTLTLEERRTCPSSCQAWLSCYGNNMPYAQRLVHGRAFERLLWTELDALNRKHPHGFLVRLHILGDFYSVGYVRLWARAIEAFPALHVFGFTARDPERDPIGRALHAIAFSAWDRFAIRFSGAEGPVMASRIVDGPDAEAITCPAQLGRTDCCATCALCWQTDRSIAFLKH